MKIVILGAGAWGTAMAVNAANRADVGHHVTLWARDAAQAGQMQSQGVNARYLPSIALPATLHIAHGAGAIATHSSHADVCIIATPMSALRDMLLQLQHVSCPVVWLCKGFETAQAGRMGLLGHEIASEICPASLRTGVLSGPSFALEVARGQPTALVAASQHRFVCDTLVAAFHSHSLRVYASDDVAGVEVGGAVKNVLAIATGLCDGLHLGLNARAALLTRGLAEMTRLGVALGAKAETLMGLSGLGDLMLTATGDLSRNRQVGLLLAQGHSLAQALDSLGHVAEGVYSAHTVLQRAGSLGIEMPITQSVVSVLNGDSTAQQAVTRLMEREATQEV